MNDKIEEFWSLIISENELLNEKGWKKWDEFNELYPNYTDIFKSYLENDSYLMYTSINFHDFDIIEVNCSLDRKKAKEVSICIFDYFNDYKKNLFIRITYTNVVKYMADVKDIIYSVSWNNDIFEILDDKKIKHRILLSNGSSIEIVCESVDITVVN